MSELILETAHVRVSWHDDERTILFVDAHSPWQWDEAIGILTGLNELVAAQTKPIYAIYHFHKGASALPRGLGLPELKSAFKQSSDNEALNVLVNSGTLIQGTLRAISRTPGLSATFAKYRFVHSVEDALNEIAYHKGQSL
jgi:hypothetical protein